ncbi:MAG TPA: hypothetical protein VH325_10600 [Bryobacteraceae bacterium]|jgi:hypothetical protein|nr:hypothetical protein [Bryobacteraceae bacterium]
MATGQHLTQDQISAWLLGERSAKSLEHIRSCSSCHAEVLLLGTTLLDFRSSVREWSEGHASPEVIAVTGAARHSLFTFNRLCLAAAAAIVCVFLGMTLRPSHAVLLPDNPITDRALMNEVDDQISRTVPTAMEPLLQLVAWKGDARTDVGQPVVQPASPKASLQGANN